MNIYKNKNKNGFTIIELIVVIAIIGVLAGITVSSVAGYLAKARDAKRAADMQTLVKAIRLYQADNSGNYPTFNGGCPPWGWWEGSASCPFETVLSSAGYLPSNGVKDPLSIGSPTVSPNQSEWVNIYHYIYSTYSGAVDTACGSGKKAVIIFNVENINSSTGMKICQSGIYGYNARSRCICLD